MQRAEQKLHLDSQLLELMYRQADLEKTVFQRKVAARNKQEDVERLKGFRVKGLLLGLTGKKIGQTLNFLLEQVLEENLPNHRDTLLTFLKNNPLN